MKRLLVTYLIAFVMSLLTLTGCSTPGSQADTASSCFTPPLWKIVCDK